jgi:hypothetical protein
MGFRADMVVEEKVIVEIKSIEEIAALHKKQLLTYLRLADKRLAMWPGSKTALRGLPTGWKSDFSPRTPSTPRKTRIRLLLFLVFLAFLASLGVLGEKFTAYTGVWIFLWIA